MWARVAALFAFAVGVGCAGKSQSSADDAAGAGGSSGTTGGAAGAATGGSASGSAACALQAAAIWDFKARNDACDVDTDCVSEGVGCGITEDGCTGAVYFASNFDRDEFLRLREEFWACAGSCAACRRAISPAGCVSGHCVIRPSQ
jgi:hypothetical protein